MRSLQQPWSWRHNRTVSEFSPRCGSDQVMAHTCPVTPDTTSCRVESIPYSRSRPILLNTRARGVTAHRQIVACINRKTRQSPRIQLNYKYLVLSWSRARARGSCCYTWGRETFVVVTFSAVRNIYFIATLCDPPAADGLGRYVLQSSHQVFSFLTTITSLLNSPLGL